MNKPQVFQSVADYQNFRRGLGTQTVGFVPTMGALHAGHASLLKQASSENQVSVLSIFINPTQFNDPKDFQKYPKTWDEDLKIAADCGITAVFYPEYAQIYPDNYRYKVIEGEFSKLLDGVHRPGHFDGMLTVVMKLLNIIQPTKAYFGEKDFQQLRLVEDMVKAFFMPIEIVRGQTVREASGLAMSSRNTRLSAEGKQKAALIFEIIRSAPTAERARSALSAAGFEVDYVEDHQQRRFVAAFLEGVRLIDNVTI